MLLTTEPPTLSFCILFWCCFQIHVLFYYNYYCFVGVHCLYPTESIIVAYIYMGIELTTWVWVTCWELNSHFLNGYQLPAASKIGQKFLCSIPNHAGMLICTVLCKSFISNHTCWEFMRQYPPQVKKISFQSSFPCFFFFYFFFSHVPLGEKSWRFSPSFYTIFILMTFV